MSVYVPPASSDSGGGCSGDCSTETSIRYAYLGSYFPAHMLSYPSHRYAYLLYITFGSFLLIASAMYHLGIGDKTWIGALWSKSAPKSRIIKIGRKPPDPSLTQIMNKELRQPQSPGKHNLKATARRALDKRWIIILPSFGRFLLIMIMIAVPIVLTLVGADYINPSAYMFDMSQSWPDASVATYGQTTTTSRRSLAEQPVVVMQTLRKRVQWGLGSFVPITTSAPNYSVPYHTWWTIGGRTGLLTNALTPLVVVVSLKQVPWALMSTKLFGRHSFEKLNFLHKWGGRLIWAFAIAHTITWSIELYEDTYRGTTIWGFVFLWPRFRWAFVSMGFLTLLVLLSVGPIRAKYYEFFYISHIICAIGFMVAAAAHHPPLAGWMIAALAWWGAERFTRLIIVAYVNGIGFAGRKPQVVLRPALGPDEERGGWKTGPPQRLSYPNSTFGVDSNEKHDLGSMSDHHHGPLGSQGNHTHSSSATLYEPSLAGHYPRKQNGGHSSNDSPPNSEPSSLHQHGQPPQHDHSLSEDEWELDEYGNKIRKRQSRRYGPVSDLLKEYTGPAMSGIDENQAMARERGSRIPLAEGGSDVGDGVGRHQFESRPGYPSQHRRDSSYQLHDGPSSSADHYATSQPSPPPHQQSLPPVNRGDLRPGIPAEVAAAIKPGYAFAQMLPGRTLRLTLRTPNRMTWQPGQWVYLNLPAVSGWQSHPFTIASAHDADFPILVSGERDLSVEKQIRKERRKQGQERTMVLLIRVRRGFTLKLWEYVRKHRHRQVLAAAQSSQDEEMGGAMLSTKKTTTGVHLRAIVDGAYGSTERVRWGIHSTIVLVCGGSGVSFGLTVLEHLCACLQEKARYGTTDRGGKNFSVQRVRFVWICREFSHLQWVASAMRRCIEMVAPEQLQVDLFVTHLNNAAISHGRPQRPNGLRNNSSFDALSGYGRSTNDLNSQSGHATPEMWKDAQGNVFRPRPQSQGSEAFNAGPEAAELEMDMNDFTEFDDEDRVGPSAAEQAINTSLRKEGKLRRAATRKRTLKRKGGRNVGAGDDDQPPLSPIEEAQRAMYEGNVSQTVDETSTFDSDQTRTGPGKGWGAAPRMRPHLASFVSQGSSPANTPPFAPQRYMGVSQMDRDRQGSSASQEGSNPEHPLATPGNVPQLGSPFDNSNLTGHLDTSDAYHPGPQRSRQPSWLSTHTNDWDARSRNNGLFTGPASAQQSTLRLINDGGNPNGGQATPVADEVDDDWPIDLDAEEELDLRIIAELAQAGHPRLDRILAQEIGKSQGRILVGSCGPSTLGALLRRIVAKHIDPAKVRKGESNGQVNLCIESFDWGG